MARNIIESSTQEIFFWEWERFTIGNVHKPRGFTHPPTPAEDRYRGIPLGLFKKYIDNFAVLAHDTNVKQLA